MSSDASPFLQTFEQLPGSLAIFPLPGVVLLPGAKLPLNIFEPRCLNMVQDAMQSSHLIGMIQPGQESESKALSAVGCAGRITHYRETGDGRFEIVLSGVCRFRVATELPTVRGYRLVQPDWAPFSGDYDEQFVSDQQLLSFRQALKQHFASLDIEPDWETMDKLEADALVNNLVMALPLDGADKQLLVEAPDLEKRIQLFITLLSSSQDTEATRH